MSEYFSKTYRLDVSTTPPVDTIKVSRGQKPHSNGSLGRESGGNTYSLLFR